MSSGFTIWIALSLMGPVDQGQFVRSTRDGMDKVLSARRAWKFRAEDVRFNASTEPKHFEASDAYNGRGQVFLLYRETKPSPTKPQADSVTAQNRQYGFDIYRTQSGSWTISRMAGLESNSSAREIADKDHLLTILIPDYYIFVYNWADVASMRSFRITQSEEGPEGRSVSFVVNEPKGRGGRLTRGTVTVDPQLGFIKKYGIEVDFGRDGKSWFTGESRHEGEIDGIPVVRRREYEQRTHKGGDLETSWSLTYTDVAKGDLEESAARISTYGLPEPAGSGRGNFPTWLAFLSVGALCLALAIWIRRRSH